jgi:hypothetical protein
MGTGIRIDSLPLGIYFIKYIYIYLKAKASQSKQRFPYNYFIFM